MDKDKKNIFSGKDDLNSIVEFYADGANEFLFGFNTTKINFFTVRDLVDKEGGGKSEVRINNATLTIPTASLAKLCLDILTSISNRTGAFESSRKREIALYDKISKIVTNGDEENGNQ
jgi:hypothetical protein